MFDFFLGRKAAKAGEHSKPAATKAAAPASRPLADPAVKAQAAHNARLRAETLVREAVDSSDAADEQALVDFIARCEFADARLIAAEAVQTRPLLVQLKNAIRNTDRRVAKLAQSRLDLLDRADALQAKAELCVQQAHALQKQPLLGANQVADLDHAWQAVSAADARLPAALTQRYQSAREALT
ncbi:MAG TPA: hypothetical protein VIT92_07510, partial [Burkholderiaceae bacterium]